MLRSSVVEALTRVYDSVWIIEDLQTERFELFRVDQKLVHTEPAKEAARRTKFSDALVGYSRLIQEEDRAAFLAAATSENIERNTRKGQLYSIPFRRVFASGSRYYRLEFTRLDLENGETNIVAGFKDVDEVVRREQETQEFLNLRATVIEALTKVYDSVWLTKDLETQEFELIRVDHTLVHLIPAQTAAKLIRFSDALAFYSRLIVPEDRQRFLEAVTPEAIEKNTKEKLLYSVPFRRMFEHEVRHYRMDFTRMNLESGETNIVAGFRDVNDATHWAQNQVPD